MGVDFRGYEAVELVLRGTSFREEYDSVEYIRLSTSFPYADGLVDGIYRVSGKRTETSVSFSYGGYNEWRSQLAGLVGTTARSVWDNPKPGPFVELINNSDCEGFIGPRFCQKLALDFAEWADRATEFRSPNLVSEFLLQHFQSQYQALRTALEIVGPTGVLRIS